MKILRLPEVKGVTGHKGDESVYGRVRTGEFTKPVKIGQRAVGWPEHEVQAIVAATITGYTPDQMKELVKQLHADRAKLLAPPPVQGGKQDYYPWEDGSDATPVQVEKATPPTPLPRIKTRRKSLATAQGANHV